MFVNKKTLIGHFSNCYCCSFHFACAKGLELEFCTLESGTDVGQGITVGPGKFVKKNKRRALNKRRA